MSLPSRLLHTFVAARFWIAPLFIALYYFEHFILLPISSQGGYGPWILASRNFIVTLLLAILTAVMLANCLWVVDYRSRLANGISHLGTRKVVGIDLAAVLDHMRWSAARLLAVTTIILAGLAQVHSFLSLPADHLVPIVITGLLILVCLFDSALDLEAEWTICVLAAMRVHEQNELGNESTVNLPETIWVTNQFRDGQQAILAALGQDGGVPNLSFQAFSGTAQNLISFAILIVGGLAGVGIFLMWQDYR